MRWREAVSAGPGAAASAAALPGAHLVWEGLKARPDWVSGAEVGRLETANDVLQGGSYHEVFLLQPQLLPFKELDTQGPAISLALASTPLLQRSPLRLTTT